MERSTKQQ